MKLGELISELSKIASQGFYNVEIILCDTTRGTSVKLDEVEVDEDIVNLNGSGE